MKFKKGDTIITPDNTIFILNKDIDVVPNTLGYINIDDSKPYSYYNVKLLKLFPIADFPLWKALTEVKNE